MSIFDVNLGFGISIVVLVLLQNKFCPNRKRYLETGGPVLARDCCQVLLILKDFPRRELTRENGVVSLRFSSVATRLKQRSFVETHGSLKICFRESFWTVKLISKQVLLFLFSVNFIYKYIELTRFECFL